MTTLRKLKTLPIIMALSVTLLLAGCTAPNPYTGEQQVNKTTWGAGIGAGTGAIMGALLGGGKGAAIGAGIGAGAGGLVGNYMDRQAANLRQELAGSGVQVSKVGNQIRLIMPGDITFATNQANIKPQFNRTLNAVAIVLRKYNRTAIRVAGFTDNTGAASYNQGLSVRRAQSVANFLMSEGVKAGRFSVVGFGERNPVASNNTTAGRAQNRRVEINLSEYR